jgi:hypothetical protein
MLRAAPAFHDEKYPSDKIDSLIGGTFKVYTKIKDKNLFLILAFGTNYYMNTQNMGFTISIGLGSEAYFGKPNVRNTSAVPVTPPSSLFQSTP